MVFVTGDTHGYFLRFHEFLSDYKQLTKQDIVIILGDFGGVWDVDFSKPDEEDALDWVNAMPFTTCFIDGNHENFDRLYSHEFKTVKFHGGEAHKIRDSVYHLMRGHVFDFEGKKFFCMGGAKSHDIEDGVFDAKNYVNEQEALDAYELWRKEGRSFRVNHLSWWKEEIPSDEELEFGRKKLADHDYNVDYVLSHCLPQVAASACGYMTPDKLTMYFDELLFDHLKYYRWYCGHYHTERAVFGRFIIKYESIERVL